MRRYWIPAFLAMSAMMASAPAQACRIMSRLDLGYIQHAEIVVVGRISNYEIVLDPKVREDRARRLAASPPANPDRRRALEEQSSFMTDYARFDVVVDEVLAGEAMGTLSVIWDNSTFGEPESMPSRPMLIALRDPASTAPILNGFSTSALVNAEPGSALTVLQAPCTVPFIFDSTSDNAAIIRDMLQGQQPGAAASHNPP